MQKFLQLTIATICIAMVIGCSNNNPISTKDSSADNKTTANITGWYSLATMPSGNYLPALATTAQYPGSIEMVRKSGNNLQHCYYLGASNTWYTGATFASAVISDPAMCSNFADNYLQVVYQDWNQPSKLKHWYRDNSSVWHEGVYFGSNCSGSPAIICNNVPKNGYYNLELIVRSSTGSIDHYFRIGNGSWTKNQNTLPMPSGYTVFSEPAMAQSATGLIYACAIIKSSSNNYYLTYWTKTAHGQVWTRRASTHDNYDIDRLVRPAIALNNHFDNMTIFCKNTNYPNALRCFRTSGATALYYYGTLSRSSYISNIVAIKPHTQLLTSEFDIHVTFLEGSTNRHGYVRTYD